jgi:hypothetical protein
MQKSYFENSTHSKCRRNIQFRFITSANASFHTEVILVALLVLSRARRVSQDRIASGLLTQRLAAITQIAAYWVS